MSHPGSIGVCDSGVGGLSVWREIVELLPDERVLYFADQAHVPYGSRSLNEVRRFAEGISRFLIAQGAKVIVIASNTTSAAGLYPLRKLFPEVPFVGMEPAIKPAAERTRTGAVGVIATQATFQGELFANLVGRYAGGVRVFQQPCPGLVEAVEAGNLDAPETTALLQRYLAPMQAAGVDQLVLGCTHYPFLRPAIERLVGPGMAIIDPAQAVARRTAQVLAQRRLKSIPPPVEAVPVAGPRHEFFTSADPRALAGMIGCLLAPRAVPASQVRGANWVEEHLDLRSLRSRP